MGQAYHSLLKHFMKNITHIFFFLVFSLLSITLKAQSVVKDSIAWNRTLEMVNVKATRLEGNEGRSPFAITVLNKYRLQTGQQLISLYETLGAIPGVFAQNPDNYAQDVRIAIRGFGARSSFGIRGIKIVVDGIPESTPDGQAKVGGIDMGFIGRMEVVRGPSSGIWGNSSGGVISLTTEDAPSKPFAEITASAGDNNFQRYQVKAGQRLGKFQYIVSAAKIKSGGYRDFSSVENILANAKVKYDFNEHTNLALLVSHTNVPNAQDPGGITQEQVDANRRQASATNVQFNAGTSVSQDRVGLVFDKKMGKHQLNVRSFYTYRDFNNRLALQASGMIEFKRHFVGGGLTYQFTDKLGSMDYRLKAGFDYENQSDDRQRYDNLNGVKGTQKLNQLENYTAKGAFLLQELGITKSLWLTVGTRYDFIEAKVTDHFLSDGNQSSVLTFNKFSPTAGVSYSVAKEANVYANISTSFETPTLNELSNNPSGIGGFNTALTPMRAVNYEIGTKFLFNKRYRIDVALFRVNVTDELVPYQLAQYTGKTFYRNAGETQRNGVEIGLSTQLAKGLTAYVNYTYSDFTYQNYTVTKVINKVDTKVDYAGKVMPGIPQHTGNIELRYFRPSGWFAIGQVRLVTAQFADDANTVEAKGYQLVNFRTGFQKHWGAFLIEPYIGVNNLLNQLYMANVQINASANKYFESSMGTYVFGGLKVRIN